MCPFNEPLLLRECGHTFCRSCVEQWCHTGPTISRAAMTSWKPICPLCRVPFTPQDARLNYALLQVLNAVSRNGAKSAEVKPSDSVASSQPINSMRSQLQTCLSDHLIEQGAPFGLAEMVGDSDQRIGLRIFLLDNSSSTASLDGRYFDTAVNGTVSTITCSRWEETKRMAMEQAAWNARMGIACEFVLLNPPSGHGSVGLQDGIDMVHVDACQTGDEQSREQLGNLERMLCAAWPMGTTPILERLIDIRHHIQTSHGDLSTKGAHIALVIATDNLPTDRNSSTSSELIQSEVTKLLCRLTSELLLSVVVRVHHGAKRAVGDYYRKLASVEEELPLSVVSDMEATAAEVSRIGNSWLTYTPLIHKILEGGTLARPLGVLNMRCLLPVEVRYLAAQCLCRQGEQPLPIEKEDLRLEVDERVYTLPLVYDPLQKRRALFVDVNGLRHAMRSSAISWNVLNRCWLGPWPGRGGAREPLIPSSA